MLSLALLLSAPVSTPGVTAAQLAQLRKTNQDIFLPTWLPKGMKAKVNVEISAQKDLTFYVATYSLGKQSFTVQSASEGIGDIFLDDETDPMRSSVVIPSFGKVVIEMTKKADRRFVVNWQDRGSRWPHYVGFLGEGMSLPTVKRILASVRQVR